MNTFGHTGLQIPLYDPRGARDDRRRFRRDALPALGRANSFYCPAGRWASRGWLLLARGDYDRLDRYSTSLQLEVGDTSLPDNVGPLNSLAIVQAQCVTRGLAADPNALYLVEVTDARGVLANQWFSHPTTSNYNIRSPAYPETFYLATMQDYPAAGAGSKTTWTWSSMLQNLWEQMPLLGSWPGLPYAPAGTPEGFWFPGVSAWKALNDVLDHLGMTVACDLTQASPFTVVSEGADDPAFDALQARYATHLEDDREWIDVGAARVPATVKVFFRRRNSICGTEETTPYRNDSTAGQWATGATYSVTIDAPDLFASAAGTHHVWSDFTVRYDEDSNPIAADVVQATLIARERVTQYFARVYSQTLGSLSRTYAGALPFATGSQVDGVCWRQDYASDARQGWRTEIVRGRYPPWEKLWDPGG